MSATPPESTRRAPTPTQKSHSPANVRSCLPLILARSATPPPPPNAAHRQSRRRRGPHPSQRQHLQVVNAGGKHQPHAKLRNVDTNEWAPTVKTSGKRQIHAKQRHLAAEQRPAAVNASGESKSRARKTDSNSNAKRNAPTSDKDRPPPNAGVERRSPNAQPLPGANTNPKGDPQPNVSSRPPSTPTASAAHSSNSSRTAPKQTPNVDPRKSLRLTTAQGGGERRRYASASSLAANTGSERPRPAEQRTHAGNVSCRITAMPATSAARRATPAATSRKSRQRASVLRQKAEQRHPIDKQWRPTASTDAKSHPGAITSGQLLKNNRRQAPPRRHTVATRGQRTEPHPAHTGSEAHPPANPNSRLPPLRAASATPQPAPASASRQHQQ